MTDSTAAANSSRDSSREALRLVREALGAEAIVLNHRVIPEGVEIVAMAEGDITQGGDAAPVAPSRRRSP